MANTEATRPGNEVLNRNEKGRDTRYQNIVTAKKVADTVRTSLGPRGMDKMIQDGKGGVVITNDGATMLREMAVSHPIAKMLVQLSAAQDVEAGDGTTSVVVLAGEFLQAALKLLEKGIHSQLITAAYLKAASKAEIILQEMASPVDLSNRTALVESASTALNSKVVSQNSDLLAPIAVDAVLRVLQAEGDGGSVDLKDVRVVKRLGGTVEDTELIDGLVFTDQRVSRTGGGPRRVENAKIGLIQFCLSPPKTDMENSITIKNYQAMDRLLREERVMIAKMVKAIAATGCNVLLIQKSILRDAVTELSLDYLAKAKILVVRDVERDDIDFISRNLGCSPVASLDHFTADKLGSASLVADEEMGAGRVVRITGVPLKSTVTVLCRASNSLTLDEAERSLHDALCVVRAIVKKRALLPGGGAPEMEMAQKLTEWARTLPGVEQLCVKAYAEALEVIPYTLGENAGLRPIVIVTELRNKHADGFQAAGINVRKGTVTDMTADHVVQPLLVSLSAMKLATETASMILKIDDVVLCR